ncbi:hypothetical protein IAT38_002445 [Cryptococcus sp. DSM 104549]
MSSVRQEKVASPSSSSDRSAVSRKPSVLNRLLGLITTRHKTYATCDCSPLNVTIMRNSDPDETYSTTIPHNATLAQALSEVQWYFPEANHVNVFLPAKGWKTMTSDGEMRKWAGSVRKVDAVIFV